MTDTRETFESEDVTRLHLSPWVKALPFAWLFMQVPRLLPVGTIPAGFTAFASLTSVAAMIAVLVLGARRLNERLAEKGTLRVDHSGVHWNNKLIAPRTKVTNGVVMPGIRSKRMQVAARVRLTRGLSRPLEFGVPDEQTGRELLRSLGLDSAQTTALFRARSRVGNGVVALVAAAVGFAMVGALTVAAGPAVFLAAMLFPLLIFAMVIPAAIPTTLVVGTDGVLLKWAGTRRYVSYQDIVALIPNDTGVVFSLRDGRTVRVEFGARTAGKARSERARIERDTFIARVEQARVAAPTPETRVDPGTVTRGERDVTAWLAALRALTQNEGGMRSAPVLRDQLFGLVDDTRLDASARAGAAAALGLNAAPPERERLRAVAATIAQPRLRVVLEAAADGDEKKLVDALDDVHEEPARTRVAG